MKLAVLYSGGKDSNLALYRAKKYHEITCLITVFPEEDSYLYHYPNIWITELQSEALRIPQIKIYSSKNKEIDNLREALLEAKREYSIEGVVTGAIKSIFQASRFQKICKDLDLWCFNPLWFADEIKLLNEALSLGFDIIISGFFAYPFNKEILGRKIDRKIVELLKNYREKYGISPAGEGGEIETTVLYSPLFKKRIVIDEYEIKIENNSGLFIIKKAHLE